ncbi:MAG: hypothetical protein JWM37_238 [Candidatus Saccharibacteria bacterium]|nr:hypothetical protein [Candidatus Saccharibacteria bacterium]
MSQNPLSPFNNDAKPKRPSGADQAAAIIRKKLDELYGTEPDAKEELQEAEIVRPRSKHQQFMLDLSSSGKSLADIQAAWHEYYAKLPDDEKHEVWQEFYSSQEQNATYQQLAPKEKDKEPAKPAAHDTPAKPIASPNKVVSGQMVPVHEPEHRSPKEIKHAIRQNVTKQAKKVNKGHFHSLLFGLVTGALVIFIFLFSFFNEVIIAPLIQPGRSVSSTPIIIDPDTIAADGQAKIIIPKINVEIPIDFNQSSTNEADIQNALNDGVVHYPTTVNPGQQGNLAIFGHSSNNIFNKGKYKFAFVMLSNLENEDVFYITYGGKVYAYRVFSKYIVKPNEVGVLGPVAGKGATATLITCDPPGTTINRLIVVGEQISPSPTDNTASTQPTAQAAAPAENLPGNGPTLWTRMWRTITGGN